MVYKRLCTAGGMVGRDATLPGEYPSSLHSRHRRPARKGSSTQNKQTAKKLLLFFPYKIKYLLLVSFARRQLDALADDNQVDI